jgi:oligopeptide/dipeptide ABC transporter ATP-binding protein
VPDQPVLEVSGLSVDYALDRGDVRAVDDVSFTVSRGEFLGIVGESGCGKSTLLFAVAQLLAPAQALAMRPKLILADEPVSMLDVSIRIGLLNLMAQLRDEQGVSILYITHDIASARYVADRLIVMYAGQIAETGPIEDVLAHPGHPYTQLLVSAVPDPRAPLSPVDAGADRGAPPKVIDPAPGCRFRWRCPLAIDTCAQVTPVLAQVGPGQEVACHVAQAALGGAVAGGEAADMKAGSRKVQP